MVLIDKLQRRAIKSNFTVAKTEYQTLGEVYECFQVLVGYIFAGIPKLVNDTVLYLCIGKHCFNRSGKSGQIIRIYRQ